MMNLDETIDKLQEVYNGLIKLSTEQFTCYSSSIVLLTKLANIALPNYDPNKLTEIVWHLIKKPPTFFSERDNPGQIERLLQNPPPSEICLRLLLQFKNISQILCKLTERQILLFTDSMIPPGSLDSQVTFMTKLADIFEKLTAQKLEEIKNNFTNSHTNFHTSILSKFCKDIPKTHIFLCSKLFNLPKEDLNSFKNWISEFSQDSYKFQQVIQLLLLDSESLMKIRKYLVSDIFENFLQPEYFESLINSPSFVNDSLFWSNSCDGMNEPNFSGFSPIRADVAQPIIVSISPDKHPIFTTPTQKESTTPINSGSNPTSNVFGLRISKQPPQKLVYQRITKPYPMVMLECVDHEKEKNLYVEATLIRSDTEDEIKNSSLEGTKIVRITGNFATFKKLKIMTTSQMQGTYFRLKFSLKRYNGKEFHDAGITVISHPIEVFSHSQYITPKKVQAPPPIVQEVLPVAGKPGSRVVVLGSNFINSSKLRVQFGEVLTVPIFHEQGTLICTTPQYQPGPVRVRVTNDSIHFDNSQATFNFR